MDRKQVFCFGWTLLSKIIMLSVRLLLSEINKPLVDSFKFETTTNNSTSNSIKKERYMWNATNNIHATCTLIIARLILRLLNHTIYICSFDRPIFSNHKLLQSIYRIFPCANSYKSLTINGVNFVRIKYPKRKKRM